VPYSDFDAPTQSLLHGAFDAAWLALGNGAGRPPPRRAATMTEVTGNYSWQPKAESVITTGWCVLRLKASICDTTPDAGTPHSEGLPDYRMLEETSRFLKDAGP
jgi:hypothetical protein